jgi:tetratricopeptide (TPR) repeat protein
MQTRRALDFEPDHALALAVEGFVHCHLKSDVDLSYQRLTSALAIDSSCSLAWLYLATVQGFRGETARAVASAIQALSLSPLDPMKYYYHCLLASAYMYDSQYELARQHGLKSWALNRYHAPTSRLLVYTHVELGELDAAKKFMTHMRQIEPDLTATLYIAKSTVAPDLRKRFAAAFVEAGLPR